MGYNTIRARCSHNRAAAPPARGSKSKRVWSEPGEPIGHACHNTAISHGDGPGVNEVRVDGLKCEWFMEGRRGQVSERTLQDNLSVIKMHPLFIVSALNRYIKFDSIDVLVVSGLNSRTISILDLIRTLSSLCCSLLEHLFKINSF